MLCPNAQAVINGYTTGWGPRSFLTKRAEIWIWGWKKCIYEKGGQSHFLQISRNLDLWMGNFCVAKKIYRAVIRIYLFDARFFTKSCLSDYKEFAP